MIGSRPIGKEAISALSLFSIAALGGAIANGAAVLSGGTVLATDFLSSLEVLKASSLQIASMRREHHSREVLIGKKPSSMYFDRISPLNRI
jgi:hypothetical protein